MIKQEMKQIWKKKVLIMVEYAWQMDNVYSIILSILLYAWNSSR